MDQQKTSILVVGATGQLGYLVTNHCLSKQNLLVNILVRDLQKNQDLVKQVQEAGGKAIQGDVEDPESLKDSTKGIHTVICCIRTNDPKLTLEGQTALLNEAVNNGVTRFFSSSYNINYSKVPKGQNLVIDAKVAFFERLAKASIKGVNVAFGLFMESYFEFQAKEFHYWGDINQKIDLLAYEDGARYIAAIASKPDLSGNFTFVSEKLSTKEITDIYNKVREENAEPKKAGSVEDLMKVIDEDRSKGEDETVITKGFSLIIYDGRGQHPNSNNKDFSEVKPLSFGEFLKENPNLKLKIEIEREFAT